jgi:TP901 family phage tail tape measure protein
MSTSSTIEIIFAGVDNLSSTLTTMGGNVSDFGGGLQDFGAPFADATEKVLGMSAALAGITVGGLTLAVTKAGEFSSGMAEVNTLLGVSAEDFSTLSDGLLEYSTTSTASMGDLQTSLYNMISLGVDYSDAISTMSTVEQLSVGTKAGLNESTEALIGTMNAYGAEIGEASNYSDAFFTIIKDGKTSMPELAHA